MTTLTSTFRDYTNVHKKELQAEETRHNKSVQHQEFFYRNYQMFSFSIFWFKFINIFIFPFFFFPSRIT